MYPRIWFVFILLITLKINCLLGAEDDRSFATSVAGMVELLNTEDILIKSLSNYADELQKKVNTIRSGVEQMRKELKKTEGNAEAYLSNPLNSFSLIRRMHADWLNWEKYLSQPVGVEHIENIIAQSVTFPLAADVEEAVSAIHRLRTTYDMSPIDMAAGSLNGVQYNARFSALDLYTIGLELFKRKQFHESCFWIYAALSVFENSDIHVYAALNFDEAQVFELYAQALIEEVRLDDAKIVINKALALKPKDTNLLRRKLDIENMIMMNTRQRMEHFPPRPTAYELGCRGAYPYRSQELHCRYNTTTSAFLKLAPIKIEEISLSPYMLLFHDVLSDAEISHLQELSSNKLKRATVYNETSKRSVAVKSRTSKFSWLVDGASEITLRINRRISDMTGFDMNGSEMLQVMNYGLGGHYDTHYDFFNASITDDIVRMHGDRMATVLFYMSDVEQGGATVFPRMNTAVFPKKGTAVMWYNLNNRGQVEENTLHAACPVIVGSKWVCNKWIRERNQFRHRPCAKE